MSSLHEKSKNSRSRFDLMRTEELEDILRLDFQLPEEEGLDTDTILYITELIACRESASSKISRRNVEGAWQDLLTQYLPDGTNDVWGTGGEPEPEQIPQPSPTVHRHSHGVRWALRIAVVAAILAVLLFVTTITAYALGYDVWGTVAKWSSETFSFAAKENGDRPDSPDQQPGTPEFSSLQEVLDSYGIETPIAPSWIPERFVLDSAYADEIPAFINFAAYYTYGEDMLLVSVLFHKTNPQGYAQWQKDDGDPIEYEKNGITHYLMTNMGRQKAVWLNGTYECGITGDISKEELIAMLDSIYEAD